MSQEATANNQTSADDIVAQADTGARNATGIQGKAIIGICITWSLYHLFIASSLPNDISILTGIPIHSYTVGVPARFIHLAFAICLATMAFPLFKSSPRDHIPLYDWALVILGVTACLYQVVLKDFIGERVGSLNTTDVVISVIGLVVLMISAYRSLGLPLIIICSVFLALLFLGGESQYIRELTNYGGTSFSNGITFLWIQTEGIFGVAIGVSTNIIFLFVLFGALLEKVGSGNWFIKVAIALLGSFRGGPAKASVLSSAMTGMISGSSIANTVTTGTFTIPLMRRIGFSAEKAGAVEVASSTNGQLTPPVMGAAAFLMIEYVGISYLEVIKHAFLPAIISYIALLYIVHLEALKLELKGLDKPGRRMTVPLILLLILSGFIAMGVVVGAVLGVRAIIGDQSFYAILVLTVLAYLALLYVSSRFPDVEVDDPNSEVVSAPRLTPTLFAGLYFALPIFVLIWNLMIEKLSPAKSALLAMVALAIIAITHHPIKAFFRGDYQFQKNFIQGWDEIVAGLISGARNMIGIGVATAATGIIVGVLSKTGAHQVIVHVIEQITGNNLIFLLVLVAIFSLILGMGLPTTANYILVSSLMANVVVEVGQNADLFVPLIAVHMFVFYFGILADDTPPVGLAAYAAAAISRGDPIKTGVQGFTYDIRTAALPFMFIFNTDLLLYNVNLASWDGALTGIFIFCVSLVAMLLFAAATQGYFIAKSRLWETAVLLLVAFTLFRPNFWMDKVYPPFQDVAAKDIVRVLGELPENATVRLRLEGPSNIEKGVTTFKNIQVFLGKKEGDTDRLLGPDGVGKGAKDQGLLVDVNGDVITLDAPISGKFGASAKPGDPNVLARRFDFDDDKPVRIIKMQIPQLDQPPKELFYIPAFLLLLLIVLLQRRRATQPAF